MTLAYNGISIIVFFKAPALECIFYDNWCLHIFLGTSSSFLLLHYIGENKRRRKKGLEVKVKKVYPDCQGTIGQGEYIPDTQPK